MFISLVSHYFIQVTLYYLEDYYVQEVFGTYFHDSNFKASKDNKLQPHSILFHVKDLQQVKSTSLYWEVIIFPLL